MMEIMKGYSLMEGAALLSQNRYLSEHAALYCPVYTAWPAHTVGQVGQWPYHFFQDPYITTSHPLP